MEVYMYMMEGTTIQIALQLCQLMSTLECSSNQNDLIALPVLDVLFF